MYRPKVRRDGLLVSELQDEILVYEQEKMKAHYLNTTTARVWQLADGSRNVTEIAGILQRERNMPSAVPIVELALEQLSRRGLLESPAPAPSRDYRRQRRILLKTIAVGLITLPVVMTVTTQPAWAQLTPGLSCTTDADCAGLPIACQTARCVNGSCQLQQQPDGTIVSALTACQDLVCQGGAPVTQNKPNGTPCSTGETSGVCSSGNCEPV